MEGTEGTDLQRTVLLTPLSSVGEGEEKDACREIEVAAVRRS